MKRFEDFEWEFDEEEEDDDIQIGDIVILKGDKYSRTLRNNHLKSNSEWTLDIYGYRYNPKYRKGMIVKKISINPKNGNKIMKIGDNWPWYLCSYWTKI